MIREAITEARGKGDELADLRRVLDTPWLPLYKKHPEETNFDLMDEEDEAVAKDTVADAMSLLEEFPGSWTALKKFYKGTTYPFGKKHSVLNVIDASFGNAMGDDTLGYYEDTIALSG